MNLPEGWKLVPVEPTEEMCRAAESCKYASSSEQWLGGYTPENVEGIYKTMLAVAPTPPAQDTDPKLVSYALDFSTCTISFGRTEMHFDRHVDAPAQEDEPVYQINLGPDKWWDDKEAFDQITIDAPPKRILYTRPQPKAQEDEPVAFVTEENGEQAIDITRLMTLSRGTKLYTRPANDELRRAAEELTEYCSGPMKPEIGRMIALTDNLRAVLRENYGTSSRIQ